MTEYPDGWLTNLSKYIGELNEELEKAKAENAELLRELDLAKRMYAKVSEEKCSTDAENAELRNKLRRYAKLYAHSIDNSRDCYDCPYYDDPACDAETVPMVDGCMLLDEMRELGVEP